MSPFYFTKNALANSIKGFGSLTHTVNLTQGSSYITQNDGFVNVYLNPSTTNGAYAKLDNISGHGAVYLKASDGSGLRGYAPTSKGSELRLSILTGADNIQISEIPFVR